MAEPLLAVRGLKVSYGGIQAVKGVDLEVLPGELVALIGANGAGKTTTLKAITRGQALAGGDVRYRGESISRLDAHALVGRGLAMVPEGRGVFARMTITENLLMGAYSRKDRAGIAADIERMFETFPRLKERARQYAGTHVRRRAADARDGARADESPEAAAAGRALDGTVADHGREDLRSRARRVAAQGMTILLVEQNARLALQSAHRAYVMDSGLITMTGCRRAMLDDPQVRAAYLGEEAES